MRRAGTCVRLRTPSVSAPATRTPIPQHRGVFVAVEFIHNVYPLASEEDHGTCCSDTLLTQ